MHPRGELPPAMAHIHGQQEWMCQGAIVGTATGISLYTNVFHLLILVSKVTVSSQYVRDITLPDGLGELYVPCRGHLTVLALLTPSVILTLGEEAEQPSFRKP